MLVVVMPFFLLGILTTAAVLLLSLGIGAGEKSTAFLVLFTLLVPFAIAGFGLFGYGLLVALLRVTGFELWFDAHNPPGVSSGLNRPAAWVRSLVHRLLPNSSAGA
jgi:hypothetical protein